MSNINKVRGLCPCAIQATYNPKWKPTLCGCLGPDKLFEECNGDYEEYQKRRVERHKSDMDRLMNQLQARKKRREEFISREGVALTPEMMKDLTCVSWPGDSIIPADQQRIFEQRIKEISEGIVLYD